MIEHQISKITAPALVKELIMTHAPAMKIEESWVELMGLPDESRALAIAQKIKGLTLVDRRQRDEVYAQLDIIDIAGSQTRETEAVEKIIKREKLLYQNYLWADFGLPKGKRKEKSRVPHNIIAWVNVVAFAKEGDKRYQKSAIAGAKRVWDRLVAQAVAASAQEGSCTFFLTPATKNIDTAIEEKCKLFEEAYKDYRSKVTGVPDYPAVVDFSVRTAFVRFSVNMAPDPHLSVQIKNDGKFSALVDPNADRFKLDYYPGRDYVRISRVVDRETSKAIVTLFADIMGCLIQDTRKKRCSFSQFEKCCPKAFALPEENRDRGDRVWISAIDSSYLDRNGNVVSKNREYDFKYSEELDIFENLRKIKNSRGDARGIRLEDLIEKRETIGLDITFKLHDFENVGGGRKAFRSDFMRPIVIKVKPGGCDYLQKTKDLKPYHKELVVDLLTQCDLMPKSCDEINEVSNEE